MMVYLHEVIVCIRNSANSLMWVATTIRLQLDEKNLKGKMRVNMKTVDPIMHL